MGYQMSRGEKRKKAGKGLRKGFWDDHHYELSKIVRGEMAPVMTPVKVYPHLRAKIEARRRRKRDNGRGNDDPD